MKKNKVVIFTKNNARMLVNPKDLTAFESMPNAVINPDLSKVHRIPMHFWKLTKGQVVEMTRPEKIARMEDIEDHGADNKVKFMELRKIKIRYPVKYYKIFSILIMGLALTG